MGGGEEGESVGTELHTSYNIIQGQPAILSTRLCSRVALAVSLIAWQSWQLRGVPDVTLFSVAKLITLP